MESANDELELEEKKELSHNKSCDKLCDKSWDSSVCLVESRRLDDIYTPIRATSRVKYTSVAVCSEYLALGTNCGFLHIFHRRDLNYRQHARGGSTQNEEEIVCIAFSPVNSEIVAYATRNGHVVVMRLTCQRDLTTGGLKLQTIRTTGDHQGASVTALCWDDGGRCVYVGDEWGRVTQVNVSKVSIPSVWILRETIGVTSRKGMTSRGRVVQIDAHGRDILVSTTKASYICNTVRYQFRVVGEKPRVGPYGACFYKFPSTTDDVITTDKFELQDTSDRTLAQPRSSPALNLAIIYCARPLSQIWEVDMDGRVLYTLKMRQHIKCSSHIPSSVSEGSDQVTSQSLEFHKIFQFGCRYLLAYNSSSIFVLDPALARIALWTNQLQGQDILDVCSYKRDIYVISHNGRLLQLLLTSSVNSSKICQVPRWYSQQSSQCDDIQVLKDSALDLESVDPATFEGAADFGREVSGIYYKSRLNTECSTYPDQAKEDELCAEILLNRLDTARRDKIPDIRSGMIDCDDMEMTIFSEIQPIELAAKVKVRLIGIKEKLAQRLAKVVKDLDKD